MSWLRIDDRFPRHRKVAPLSDAAFRLHVTAMAECCEAGTDGHVALGIPATLTRAPQGKALQRALTELVAAGVWHVVDLGGWQIHDFLDWNLSAAHARLIKAARAAAGQAGGKRTAEQKRSKAEANAKQLLELNGSGRAATFNPEPEPEETTTAEADASARTLVPIDELLAAESAEQITVPARKEQRACRLPKDYPLTAELRTIAEHQGCRDPQEMHAAFVDYWRGRGRSMLDWTATYRTWARDGHCGNPVKACACMRTRGANGQALTGSMAAVRRVGERILGGNA